MDAHLRIKLPPDGNGRLLTESGKSVTFLDRGGSLGPAAHAAPHARAPTQAERTQAERNAGERALLLGGLLAGGVKGGSRHLAHAPAERRDERYELVE